MKFIQFFISFWLIIPTLKAQNQKSTEPKTLFLNEVVVKNTPNQKKSKKIKSQNVYVVVNPDNKENINVKSIFATRFERFENKPIRINQIELKLIPFDTNLIKVNLIVFQVREQDTLLITIPIDNHKIVKNKLKMNIEDYNVSLKASDFYIGFEFFANKLTEQYKYKLFATNKGGRGAIIHFRDKKLSITENDRFPYIFPFTITYK